jgi:hypothetical protein
MTAITSNEKRQFPRYLCPDEFSDTVLYLAGHIYTLVSVNFNHRGMALYSHQRLPETTACYLSFQYRLEHQLIVINQLPSIICYRVETEVGHQYGIKFDRSQLNEDYQTQLLQIEQHLVELQSSDNRWR